MRRLLMTGHEAVVADDHRQAHFGVLADAHGRQVEIVDGLRVARAQHDPSRVEGERDVGVIAADVERRRDSAGGDVEDHRHARAGLDGLERVEQPLRALVALITPPPPSAAP